MTFKHKCNSLFYNNSKILHPKNEFIPVVSSMLNFAGFNYPFLQTLLLS